MQKDFMTITPESGRGGSQEVTVAVSANTGNARSSTITIQGGGITRTIDVSQEGKPTVTISLYVTTNKYQCKIRASESPSSKITATVGFVDRHGNPDYLEINPKMLTSSLSSSVPECPEQKQIWEISPTSDETYNYVFDDTPVCYTE